MNRILTAESKITSERDAMELLNDLTNSGTNLLIIPMELLSGDFFDLSTGLAGAILQKLVNYHVKTAFVLPESFKPSPRMEEFLRETNRGNDIRSFPTRDEAVRWLESFE